MKGIKNKKITLADLGGEWLSFNRNSLKKSSFQTYEYLFKKHILNSGLSYFPIGKITAEDIVRYSDELLDSNLSPKTINCILLTLNRIFKYAEEVYGFMPPKVGYVKDIKREMRVLSTDEQSRLERCLKYKPDNYKTGMLFALYTGVRIGELCALRWGDIRHGTVRINKTMHRLKDEHGKSVVIIDKPKTESSNRTIPLPDFLAEIVENMRRNDDEFILSCERVARVEPRLMQKKFKKTAEECGLEGVTFHTLRHTFATRCIECGFDPKTLSEILGHSDVKTTLNRYVHCSLELKKNSMNLLSRIAV